MYAIYKTFFVKSCVLAIAIVISLPGQASSSDKSKAIKSEKASVLSSAVKPSSVQSATEKKWGVRPVSMQLTATDYMLDFRYMVVDPEKAAAIVNRKTKPYLIVEKTGIKLSVPSSYKVGPLRQSAQFAKPGRNYFMLFANPGRLVKSGDKVTIIAGDFKLEHVTVN